MTKGLLIIRDLVMGVQIERIPYEDYEDLIYTLLSYLNDGVIEYLVEPVKKDDS